MGTSETNAMRTLFILCYDASFSKTQPVKAWGDTCKTYSLDKQIVAHLQNGTPHSNVEKINPIHPTTQMNLKSIMQRERSSTQKSSYYDSSIYMKFWKRQN